MQSDAFADSMRIAGLNFIYFSSQTFEVENRLADFLDPLLKRKIA